MTNANNDVRELEDLLTELEGQGALPVGPYSDEDDAVTQLMDAPLGEQEWMVQITPLDRRMMSTDQVIAELATGTLVKRDTLVWRAGMSDWAPIARMDDFASTGIDAAAPPIADRRPVLLAPLPPPAPVPPPRLGSSTMASPQALSPNGLMHGAPANGLSNGVHTHGMSNGQQANPVARAPLPPVPSTPYGAPKPLTPVPDVPPPATLPLLNSAFGSPGAPPPPSLSSNFNVPPPAAAPHPPAPPTLRVSTQRPVAVDFSEMEPVRTAPVKVLVGSGLAALAMIVGTVYALSAGGVFDSGPEIAHEPAPAASKPSAPTPPSVVAKPAEPAPAAAKPVEEKRAEAKEQPADDKTEPAVESEPQTQKVSAKEEMVAAPEPKERRLAKSDAVRAEAVKSEPVKADEPKAEASSDEASESTASRAERRLAARRNKRASAEEAPAPRRNKPRAAAVAAAGAEESDEAAKGGDTPGSTFNKQAAKTALDDAAAQAKNCQPQGGPRGAGKVQVRYEPNGKVGAVSILTPQFDNTTTGSCVVMVFRRASIPAFTGSPAVVMNKSFDIP
jgi:hypothetical protein